MYNLAKLLTDEPKRLERLIILFLKLIITLYLTGMFFDYTFNINSLIENPVPKTLTTNKLILFFVSCVTVWFIFWNLVMEMLLSRLPVWFLTKKLYNKAAPLGILDFLDVVKVSGDKIVGPKKHIIEFTESLKENDDIDDLLDEKNRLREYYLISIGAFFVILLSGGFSFLGGFFAVFVILNLFVAQVLFGFFHKFLDEDYTALIRQFDTYAYAQKVYNGITENEMFKGNYEIPVNNQRMKLKRKVDYEWLPPELKIEIAFYWDKQLGQIYMSDFTKPLENRRNEHYVFVISNIPVNDKIAKFIYKQEKLIYINADNDEEIYSRLEEAFYRMREDYMLRTQNGHLE